MKSLDLSKLLGSNCRTKLLEKFLLEYESGNSEGFHMRLLARELDEQINSIKRELDNLSSLGFLKYKTELRKKVFFINQKFIFLDEMTQIFLKNYNPLEKIKPYLKEQPLLEVIIVNKNIQYKLTQETKSILDIFLIGEINRSDFHTFLSGVFYNRKIKYAIIHTKDFYDRISYGDKLISNILSEPGNLVLKDTIDIQSHLINKQ